MKKIDLGQTIGTLANIGVLAGIIFLGIEFQQNTNIARASAYRENVQDIAEWRSLIASDPDLSRIVDMYTGGAFSDLDPSEINRLSYLINNLFGSYENAFYATKFGIIGESEWQRFEIGACLHFGWVTEYGMSTRFITEEFRAYLRASC